MEGWKHPCHFLWSPEWVCVICLFLSAWSVGKGVCPYCVTVLLLGWWKPNDRWCLREKLMWLEKGCVCVLFPCMSPQGCQQGGTTGPVMRSASMVQAYSLVLRKDKRIHKIVLRALWVVPVSLLKFSLLLHFWWLHKHLFYYLSLSHTHTHTLTLSLSHTHTHTHTHTERALLQKDANHFQLEWPVYSTIWCPATE